MREIKFRAWDKRTKYMAEVVGFKYTLNGKIEIWYKHDDEDIDLATCEKKHIVLMQYTGLKDKNGTELYEGDIVKFNNEIYQAEKAVNTPSIDLWDANNEYVELNDMFCDEYEVIGNIYESPELLESEE